MVQPFKTGSFDFRTQSDHLNTKNRKNLCQVFEWLKQYGDHSKIEFPASLDCFIENKYFLLCIKWSSLGEHLKTGHFVWFLKG